MFWKNKNVRDKYQSTIDKILADQDRLLPPALEKPNRDWHVFRPSAHVALKVWLPERVDDYLRQIAEHESTSRSSLIRDGLFIFTYGRFAYLQMREARDGLFYTDPNPPMYSRSRNRAPHLGKNSVNYKVWLPQALKNDLQLLATKANLTLSHFVREVLISHFLGHLELPTRQELLAQSKAAAEDWPPDEGTEK